MKKLLLIINPTSGRKKAEKHIDEIVAIFEQAQYQVQLYLTSCRGDATEAVKQLTEPVDLVVCCGGDGTFNETVSGVLASGMDMDIGYIPAGSTNDFASSLNLSNDILEAARQIVNGQAKPYDVGSFGDRYFTYVASFGAFTKASYATSQKVKNMLGHMAYILGGVKEVFHIHKEHICMQIDGETVEDDFIFGAVCNSTSVGGVLTLKQDLVDMNDGKFEIMLVRAPKHIKELTRCVSAIRNQTYDCEMITFRSASSLQIQVNPEMPWTLDGEKADGSEHITIENLQSRIKLVH